MHLTLELTRIRDVADPDAFQSGPCDYFLRWGEDDKAPVTVDWSPSLLGALTSIARGQGGEDDKARLGDTLRNILQPAGWSHRERALSQALGRGEAVTWTLTSDAAELHALPWERLRLSTTGERLYEVEGLHVRHRWPQPAEANAASRVSAPRVLLAWSDGGGWVPWEAQRQAVEASWGSARVHVVERATLPAIKQRLLAARDEDRPFTVLHLLAHGALQRKLPGVHLDRIVSPSDLRRALAPAARELDAVVLSLCHGGASAPAARFSPPALALNRGTARYGPFAAVLASRGLLSAGGSIPMTRALHQALSCGEGVMGALAAAREVLLDQGYDEDAANLQLYAHGAPPGAPRPSVEPAPIEASASPSREIEAPLAGYLRALEDKASALAADLRGPRRSSLRPLYVRLRLKLEHAAPQLPADLPAQARLVQHLDGPVRRWVVLGGPGSGKTTSLRQEALALARREAGPLPVLLKLPRVLELGPWRAVEEEYGAAVAAALRDQPRERLWMLDGLDEVPELHLAHIQVTRQIATLGDERVLVTCREKDYRHHELAGFTELELEPMGPEEQDRLLAHFVPEPGRRLDALARLRSRPGTARIAGTPLLLSLVGALLEEGEDAELPMRRAELYERALKLALEPRRYNPERLGDCPIDPMLARELLGVICLALHAREGSERLPLAKVRKLLRQREGLSERVPDPEAALRALAEHTCLFQVIGAPGSGRAAVYFPHRTYREFLAAEELVRRLHESELFDRPGPTLEGRAVAVQRSGLVEGLPEALEAILRASHDDPQAWSEVLALACGLLEGPEADTLVAWIAADGNARLVARVVAEGEGLSARTINTALGVEQGWASWEARRDLLLELPETVGDLEVVVGLVQQFAAGTADGNDLFWAQELLRRIGAGEVTAPAPTEEALKSARARAQALAEGFYMDRRVTQRAALLAELERRGWWKAIPEGRFVMGSPESDSQGFSDERPQHEVQLLHGFKMLAVPVTWWMYGHFDEGFTQTARDDFNGRCPSSSQDEHPVYNLTWYAARAFAAWLSAGLPDGQRARLPLEAEWEYACRGPERSYRRYWSGDSQADLRAVGWYGGNAEGHTWPVASPRLERGGEHPWGLHDMHGNVWEWCLDAWDRDAYAQRRDGLIVSPWEARFAVKGQDSPTDAANLADLAAVRVIRGGCWYFTALFARSAYRSGDGPGSQWRLQGFRLVLVAPPEP